MTHTQGRRFDLAKHYATVLGMHLRWVSREMVRDGDSWGCTFKALDGTTGSYSAAELYRIGPILENSRGTA